MISGAVELCEGLRFEVLIDHCGRKESGKECWLVALALWNESEQEWECNEVLCDVVGTDKEIIDQGFEFYRDMYDCHELNEKDLKKIYQFFGVI